MSVTIVRWPKHIIFYCNCLELTWLMQTKICLYIGNFTIGCVSWFVVFALSYLQADINLAVLSCCICCVCFEFELMYFVSSLFVCLNIFRISDNWSKIQVFSTISGLQTSQLLIEKDVRVIVLTQFFEVYHYHLFHYCLLIVDTIHQLKTRPSDYETSLDHLCYMGSRHGNDWKRKRRKIW